MRVTKVALHQGYEIPWGYGYSYSCWNLDVDVYYPWPVNHFVKWARELWFFVRDAKYTNSDRMAHLEAENKALKKALDKARADVDGVRQAFAKYIVSLEEKIKSV